ncbi:MAG: SpoIIE family protein phosphatase, partial [Lachnospiraceae bacterium]|nr:SpoIIE family protein phosphatase [Lachnospiraceae bacterium]
MGFPIRRKVFLLTVALSLALIGAAVFISYALYSNRVRRDVEEGCKSAAENMADELENYHAEFIISIQQQIDQLYQENVAEIEKWSDDFENLEARNAFFDTLTASVFPARGKLGLSYEKSVFLGNYNNLRAMLNISSTGVGMQDAQVFYLDRQRQYMVHLVDSVASQSPLHHPPGSISEMDEDFRTHCLDQDTAEAYTVSDYFSMAACPVRIEGLNAPVYIMFTDNLEEAYSHRQGFMWTVALVLLGSTALLALVYLLFVDRFVAKNIEKLSAATESFTAQMEAETSLQPVPAQVKTRDELGALSDRLDLMQNKLVEYVETIGEKTAREESMRAELNLAARIQREALPLSGFEAGIFRIDSFLKPAKEVGGDLYDYFLVDEDHLFFVVADVSGKGVPAALFMMRGKELIRAHAAAGLSPGEIAKTVNMDLCRGNEEGLFITAFFGLAELSTGRLTYARAGHEQPFLIRKGRATQISEESNFMLGLFDNFDFAEDSLTLEAGDRLLVFTDGLNEGINPRQEAFGYERIQAVLEESRGNALPELVEALTRFSEGEEQFDDVTMLQLTVGGGDSCPPPDAGEGGP